MHAKPDCELLLYPNPIEGGQITISFCYQMKSIEIVDMNGSTLIFKQADSENYVLTHQLSSGIYFLKVAYNNGMISKKIFVE